MLCVCVCLGRPLLLRLSKGVSGESEAPVTLEAFQKVSPPPRFTAQLRLWEMGKKGGKN